jgi:hypothetical protein
VCACVRACVCVAWRERECVCVTALARWEREGEVRMRPRSARGICTVHTFLNRVKLDLELCHGLNIGLYTDNMVARGYTGG